ncbi:MAG: DUF2784 domain-containing protein [Chlorobiales bacterium]|nr:DUF2784 domain-containing protein [Chlorobiales bacterium]
MLNLVARIVLLTHSCFIIWALFGGFVARNNTTTLIVQLLCVSWGLITTWFGVPCPLTLLEKWLLAAASSPVYEGECLPHYLWEPWSIPQGPTLAISMLLLLLLLNGAAYYPLLRKRMSHND